MKVPVFNIWVYKYLLLLFSYKTKIEPVGSCCTLVAEEIFNTDENIMDPQIAMLLYGMHLKNP